MPYKTLPASFPHHPDLGKLLLRATCGGLLLFHGSNSLMNGVAHIKDMVVAAGLPEFLAYLNLIGEVLAPVALLLGVRSRIAAFLIAVNMLASVLIAHRDIFFARNDFGGWMIELNVFYFMTAVVIILIGGGRFALSRQSRWD